jgi:RNA 2',3'-cyclic 3'-phosphodiesterase
VTRGASARLFVAVDPPPPVAAELAAWTRRVVGGVRAESRAGEALRVLDPDLLHVTLCFLGSRPVGEIDVLLDALHACAQPSFELSLGAPLWLPTRRPNALAVEVHDHDGHLADLQQRVSATAFAPTSPSPASAAAVGATSGEGPANTLRTTRPCPLRLR